MSRRGADRASAQGVGRGLGVTPGAKGRSGAALAAPGKGRDPPLVPQPRELRARIVMIRGIERGGDVGARHADIGEHVVVEIEQPGDRLAVLPAAPCRDVLATRCKTAPRMGIYEEDTMRIRS